MSNLFYRWNFEKAGLIATSALELYPDDLTLLDAWIGSFKFLEQHEKELDAALTGVQRHPDNPDLWTQLGLAFMNTAKPDSAEYALRKSLSIDPSFYDSQMGLALLSYCRGETRHAIERSESILSRSDLSATNRIETLSGYLELSTAQFYAEMGQCSRAIEAIDVAWPLAGRNEGAKKRLGYDKCRILKRSGRYEDALEFVDAIQDTMDTDRRAEEFEWFRAQILIALDDIESAREVQELRKENVVSQKDNVHIAGISAELELAEGRAPEAIDAILQYKRIGGWAYRWDELEGRTLLAHAYHMAGRSDEAIAELEELLRIYKGHALGHYELGKIYEDIDRLDDAGREYAVFLEMWSEADEDMPQLIDARKRYARLQSGGI